MPSNPHPDGVVARPVSRRSRQAATTRRELLAAARRLFAAQGYAATSVRDVAGAAGVSVQTVYDSVGSKQALVAALNDLIDDEAGIPAKAATIAGEVDPYALVGLVPHICAAIVDTAADIFRTLVAAAPSEPALAGVLVEARRRHRAGSRRVAQRLRDLGALRADLAVDDAGERIAAACDPACCLVYVDVYGWSAGDIGERLTRTLSRDLLAPAGAAAL